MGQLVFQATAGGQVALVGPNPSASFSLNVPAVSGTLVTTGDTGTVTNTMLASNAYTAPGAIGSVTPSTGAFTTLSASSTVSGAGFSTYLASPPAIGGTAAAAGTFTTLTVGGNTQNQQLGQGNASIMKNRIINGAMVIDQRNAGASVTASGSFPVDRFKIEMSQSSKVTWQQNAGGVTKPIGFTNYVGATSSSAYSLVAGDYFILEQLIEGYNVADLGWGTANAKTVTLSFQVYSSLTGTFGGAVSNNNNRAYPFTYSIPVANTWTTISVTIAGDTSGTWATTNGTGIFVNWSLGTGSTYSGTAGSWTGSLLFSATGATSVVGTSGATFYITGVQLEVGSSATGFEYRQYQQELALCQRYYTNNFINTGGALYNTNSATFYAKCPVTMRTGPTPSLSSGTTFNVDVTGGAAATCTPTNFDTTSVNGFRVFGGLSSSYSAFNPAQITSANIQASAEL